MSMLHYQSYSHARIVPWKSLDDLLWVKNAFYPPPNAADQRYGALTMVYLDRKFTPKTIQKA